MPHYEYFKIGRPTAPCVAVDKRWRDDSGHELCVPKTLSALMG